MRIGLVGSWKAENVQSWNLSNESGFFEASRIIGTEIARKNHQIVVGSGSRRAVDYHAVEGVVQALGSSTVITPPIAILRPNDEKTPYEDFRTLSPHLFTSSSSPDSKWRVTHLFQIERVDALVIVGGGELSYQAGVAAAVAGRRVIPVGSFGGAGERLIRLFQLGRGQWGSNVPTDDELGALWNPWNSAMVALILRLLGPLREKRVFIGHGHSPVWEVLRDFVEAKLGLSFDEFNRVPVAGITTVERISQMLNEAGIAFLVMTAEDEQKDGGVRARSNVVHEAGLVQGRLGFQRAVVLLENGCEDFSNISGLGHIPFPKGDIASSFDRVQAVLKREGFLD